MIKLQEAALLVASLCAVGFSYAALRNTAGSRHGNAVLSPNPVHLEQLIPLADALVGGTSGDVIVQALDYECPPCRGHEIENRAFRAKHPETGWLILQFPLGMHRHAYPLSLAALEADRLGAFREFHTAVMAKPILPQESVGQYLSRVAPSLAWIGAKDLRKDEDFRKRLDTIRHLPI
ncbi:MAG TPA: hypothetical protein VG820_08650, partial [Fimbriimonadaceae bacterium]|nr:hypothetical protein [Fimbriimonadaceae bacterium]